MPTLLLPPRITDDSVKLWRAAIAANWQTLRLNRWHAPENLDPADIAVYGGYFTAFANDLGISLIVPPNNFLATLPHEFTKRHVQLLPLAEARHLTHRAFYKPADDKCFLAKIYDAGAELPAPNELPDDVPVLISEIVRWQLEFRCFILDRKLITLSPYLRNHGKIETPDGEFPATDEEFSAATTFINALLATTTIPLPPTLVIDVGLTQDRGWAVIEANQVWGAGIYGCDPSAILPILRRACQPTATISDSDKQWAALT
jgi:ATP-grasp domain, R2K clade family 2